MKHIYITLEDWQYEMLSKLKDATGKTWIQVLMAFEQVTKEVKCPHCKKKHKLEVK